MKSVTGGVTTAEPISLSRAAKILSGFVSSKNGASQDVSAYLRRASATFIELKSIHREIKSSTKPRSLARQEWNPTGELEKLARAKGIYDLVESGGKIGFRKSEIVSEDESIYAQEHDVIKEGKEKKKKIKSKKEKEEDVDENVESDSKNKEKKRKNDEEMASVERKSKKRRFDV